ncbi:Hypothetical Protein FCC1311_031952 [Hondaea fermentalgiana]|uniref:Wntless-like transmembrane domain-containing protein n=1 Tax=Hondaea fermentalgiana TaxID=2315210 RepID=A0A2R5G7E2_9STRA|nr:Hypothetical Protein FCC1311_031952 [Hondaea fermentalgiana]|eukprot:GBG26972.1 Hypothetical Protein FCC1311_031952 [Hondaea fermentalgiana]
MPATASREDKFDQETIELDASVAVRAYDCAAEQGEQKAGLLAEVELSEADHACVPAHVISLNLARYPAYRVLITFEDDWILNFASEETGPQDPQVFALLFLEHISKDFATFEIVFKYALFFAGILVLALFASLLRKATAISLDQKWVAMLCVEVISFNDPLCALDDALRNVLFPCLQAVGVVSFLSMLGLFWIFAPLRAHARARFAENKSGPSARRDAKVFNVAAAALSMPTHKVPRSRYADGHWETSLPPAPAHDSPPDGFSSLTFTQRHWSKLFVCTLIWLAVSVAKALEAVKRYQDPLVNPSQAVSVDWFLKATTACMFLSILAWGLATILHGALLFQSMQTFQLSHLALNVGLLVFLLVRTVLHAHDAEPNRGQDMVFVHGFLSTYIWLLALLFAPPVASANLASADGAANDLDKIGPVSPVPVRIVRTTSEVDRLYTRRVSEESAPNSYFTRVNSLDEDDEAHVAEIHEHIYIEPADPEADGGPTWTMRRCYPV